MSCRLVLWSVSDLQHEYCTLKIDILSASQSNVTHASHPISSRTSTIEDSASKTTCHNSDYIKYRTWIGFLSRVRAACFAATSQLTPTKEEAIRVHGADVQGVWARHSQYILDPHTDRFGPNSLSQTQFRKSSELMMAHFRIKYPLALV